MTINNITGRISDTTFYGTDPINATTTTVAATKASTKSDAIPAASLKSVVLGANALPQLPDPLSQLSGMIAAPSLGADVLALVQDLTDEQRRANNEQRFAESQAVVQELHNQASDMRSQAAWNLALGITVAVGQIAAGVTQTAMTSRALAKGLTDSKLQAATTQISGISQSISGTTSIASAVKEFVNTSFDASMKDRDAKIEMCRAYLSQLDSLNDALKEVIRNARENQNAIQQNTNQTRVKILS